MSDKGWIKTYRKLQDCWIWSDKEPFDKRSAWIDLLLTANHADKKLLFNGQLITVKRGQILTSIRKLSERWKWSINKVYRFLKLLENDEMLQRKSDNDRTLITIENYSVYQDKEYTNEYTNENSIEYTMDTPSEYKQELKNDKNNILCSNSLNEQEIEEQKKNEIDKQQQRKELENNFEIIYKSYPKKKGKARGFDLYKGWLKGRDISGRKIKLTNRQIWSAIAMYKKEIEENGTELQFVQQFDTFMNKTILDYVGDDGE